MQQQTNNVSQHQRALFSCPLTGSCLYPRDGSRTRNDPRKERSHDRPHAIRVTASIQTALDELDLFEALAARWQVGPRPTAPSLPLPICARHLLALSPRYAASSAAFSIMIQFTLQISNLGANSLNPRG